MSEYTHATPGRVMSTLAYRLLSTGKWPVYVNTSRNYTAYGQNHMDAPTDPGDTLHGDAHFRPVSDYNPFVYDGSDWAAVASYMDDRINADEYSHDDAQEVVGPWDEYFIYVEGEHGGNIANWGDYLDAGVAESNYRVLTSEYPDTFVEVSYAYNGHALAIPVFVPVAPEGFMDMDHDDILANAVHYDPELADELAGRLEGLENYPLLDEEDHSNLEREKVEEALADSWWQGQIREGVAERLSELVLKVAYPLDTCTKDDPTDQDICMGSCTGTERAAMNGVDTYDFQKAVEGWLDDAGDVFLAWDFHYYGDFKDAAHYSVYDLFGMYSEERCHIVFEESGPTFLHTDESYQAVAEHIHNNLNRIGNRAEWPALPLAAEHVS